MAEQLEFDTTIDIPAQPPWVPEKIERFVRDQLIGCKRVMIHHEVAKGRWQKSNGFKLDGTPNKAPTHDAEIVSAAVMMAIEAHHSKLGKGDELAPAQTYRVMFLKVNAQGQEARPSCEYLYSPSGEESFEATDDEQRDNERDFWLRSMERLEAQNKALFDEVRNSNTVLKDMANNQAANLAPFATMIGFMTNAWVAGATMQQQAMGYMFSEARAREDARSSDRKFDVIVESVKTPLIAVLEHKFGIKLNLSDDEDDDEDDDDAQAKPEKKPAEKVVRQAWDGKSASAAETPSDAPVTASSPASSAEPIETTATDAAAPGGDERKDPAAWFARGLGQTIRPAQWRILARNLEDSELDALTKLLESKTDKQVIARYDKIFKKGAISMLKLKALAEQLDDTQRTDLEALQQLVESARAGYAT